MKVPGKCRYPEPFSPWPNPANPHPPTHPPTQRGDVASGEGLQSVAGGGVNGTGSFFEDDDVLLSEMREDAERRRLSKGAGAGHAGSRCRDRGR